MKEFLDRQRSIAGCILCRRISLGIVLAMPIAGLAHAASDDLSDAVAAPAAGSDFSNRSKLPSTPARVLGEPVSLNYALSTPTSLSPASTGTSEPVAALLPSAPNGIELSTYTKLAWKGLDINLPGPEETLDRGAFGLRQKLASYGIGYFGYSADTFFGNVLHSEHNNGNAQQYVGQKSTGLSNNFLTVTFDLSQFGVPDGQIAASGTLISSS